MAIDFDAVLAHPGAREALMGRLTSEMREELVRLNDPDYTEGVLHDFAHDNLGDFTDQVLCLSWDGNAPGNSGALYVGRWLGMYFITSSDYDPSGPYFSIEEVLREEYFSIETSRAEVSGSLPTDTLLRVAEGVGGGNDVVMVNDVPYHWVDGELRRTEDAGPLLLEHVVAKGTTDVSLNARMPARTKGGWSILARGKWSQGPYHEGTLTYEYGKDADGVRYLRAVNGSERRLVAIATRVDPAGGDREIARALYDAAVEARNIELEGF